MSNKTQTQDASSNLRPLSGSERLRKHVSRLQDLTDPETLSTENNEDAVAEFDDRLKEVNAKATLISKIVGEKESTSSAEMGGSGASSSTVRLKKNDDTTKQMAEMEDFAGLPGTRKHATT